MIRLVPARVRAVVPGHPPLRAGCDLVAVPLQLGQVVERVGLFQLAGVDQAHEQVADATDFDERDINRNFAYDYEAYREVKRNLGRLIDAGQLRLAMQLALELMKRGSYQVEMSDEGLMTRDIED